MSVETTSLEELGRELGEAIRELPEYQEFEAAKQAVEDDEQTQEKISEFERLRSEFVVARQAGDATQEDLEALQETQETLHSMPLMEEYLDAQDRLQSELEAINRAISEPLAVDFGEESGGCCND